MNTKSIGFLAAATLAALVATPSALGFAINIEKGSFQSGYGGEFVAIENQGFVDNYASVAKQTVGFPNPSSRLHLTGFSTFCLERSENLNYNDNYLGTLNLTVMNGGTDNTDPGPGDPISKGTAWLYQLFATGSLSTFGYAYGTEPYSNAEVSSRKNSAGLLQNAIWSLEDELNGVTTANNQYLAAAVSHFGSLALAKSAADASFGVSAINMVMASNPNIRRQDVLVYLGTPVPDSGATMGLLGAGLAGIGIFRRRSVA
ncbi:MAG: VPDSG-CTERM sorting domain-containing protein [Verrucomicrobiales bacterium]|nr:VPDSG-CTERM sorting domain-containing protein [Verrucomicrobiales bacterium]